MPLFGSNFAQGLVTGFAESTSKNIEKAMAQREEDVSAAKKFAMTRAAQLEEQATAKDKRTQKAIDKMASKFTKNGETDWNRVYGAIMATDGGDLDSLDALFANMQKSSANGIEFDINDVFTFAEGDETLNKLSRDDIFQALRAEYEAPTVRTTDTTLLSKIGLGVGTAGGEAATEQMRGLFPGATRTAIQGDYGTATLQQDKLAAAIEYGMKVNEYKKNMTPSLAEAYASTAANIGKLDINSPTYTQDLKELEAEQNRNIANIAEYTRATTEETTAKGSMTASGFARVITDGEASALALSGINEKLGIYTDANGEVKRDGLVNPQGIASAKKKALEDYYEKHVRGQMDGNGQLSFLGQQVIMNRPELKAIYDRITSTDTTTTTGTGDTIAASTQTGDILTTPAADDEAGMTKDALVRKTYPTADGYLNGAMDTLSSNNTAPNYNKLLENIMRIYNLDADAASAVIQKRLDADAEKAKADKVAQANKPTFMTREEAEKEAERIRLAQESADFAGSGA